MTSLSPRPVLLEKHLPTDGLSIDFNIDTIAQGRSEELLVGNTGVIVSVQKGKEISSLHFFPDDTCAQPEDLGKRIANGYRLVTGLFLLMVQHDLPVMSLIDLEKPLYVRSRPESNSLFCKLIDSLPSGDVIYSNRMDNEWERNYPYSGLLDLIQLRESWIQAINSDTSGYFIQKMYEAKDIFSLELPSENIYLPSIF